jgi:hypothetical protein
VHGWGENEIPNAFIGPDVRAKISFMRHEVKTSYKGTRLALQCFGNLTLSPGALVGFDNHISQQGKPLYEALKQSLSNTPFIHVDETGWKRDWLWIFTNPDIAFFHIDESRGSKVVIDHLGEFYNGVLITDFWSAYLSKIGAFAKQKCLVHLLRDIRELLKNRLPLSSEVFLRAVKRLLKDAIFLYNQHTTLTPDEYRSGRKDILKRFRKLLRQAPLSHHDSDNIRKRLIKFKNELFVFLKYPAVSPTNHVAAYCTSCVIVFFVGSFWNSCFLLKMRDLCTLGLPDFIKESLVWRFKQTILGAIVIFINFKYSRIFPFFQRFLICIQQFQHLFPSEHSLFSQAHIAVF